MKLYKLHLLKQQKPLPKAPNCPWLELHRLAEAQCSCTAGDVSLTQPVICPAHCWEGRAALPITELTFDSWNQGSKDLQKASWKRQHHRKQQYGSYPRCLFHTKQHKRVKEDILDKFTWAMSRFGLASGLPPPQRLAATRCQITHEATTLFTVGGSRESWAACLKVKSQVKNTQAGE